MLCGTLIKFEDFFEEEWKNWLVENKIKFVRTSEYEYTLFFKPKKIKKLLKYAKKHGEKIRGISLVD